VAKLLYQGHASIRITADDGTVVYIDPFAGKGYEIPADLILVTHQHSDHNRTDLPARKKDCVVIQESDAQNGGDYKTFHVKGLTVTAFPASNKNHDRSHCVGYIVTVDGKKVYHAGDTSKVPEMSGLSDMFIDYALLPTDGKYNMDAREAAECAAIITAAHSIPFHTDPRVLFDESKIKDFNVETALIIRPNDEIAL
jgi:L-ascorbate metabolism protein UlaG (beta-lactamase superfamily)